MKKKLKHKFGIGCVIAMGIGMSMGAFIYSENPSFLFMLLFFGIALNIVRKKQG